MSARVTLKSVAKHIRQMRGVSVELVRGEGYFYFVGEAVERWPSASVLTYRLTNLTLAEWLAEYDQLAHEARFA